MLSKAKKKFYREKARRETEARLVHVEKEESPVATDSLVVYKEAEEVPAILGKDKLPELLDGNASFWLPHKGPTGTDIDVYVKETIDGWVFVDSFEMAEDAKKISILHHFVMGTAKILFYCVIFLLVSLYFEAVDHVVILVRIVLGFSLLIFHVLWRVSVPVLAWLGALLVRFPLPSSM